MPTIANVTALTAANRRNVGLQGTTGFISYRAPRRDPGA
jgi:hypothetical protein